MGRLRLFVVGEKSGDPEKWHVLGKRALVAAYSPEQAASMVELCGCGVAELELREPLILFVEEDNGSDD